MLFAFWLHYTFVCALSDQRKSIALKLFCILLLQIADLSWSLISQYHGSLLCNGALVCVVGACMSISEQRNSFNCSAEWFDLEAMYVEISWLNLSLFIELRFRLITGTDGGLGMLISRLQSIVK